MRDLGTLRRLPLLAPLIAACRPVHVLDSLVPKDARSRMAAADLAYGPHPRQRFDLYVPEGEAAEGGPLPLLLFIYGGGWRSGRKADYRFADRALAALGYVTAVADYRLVPEVRYPDFLIDCGRALAAFRAAAADFGGDAGGGDSGGGDSGGGDAGRIFLAGHSAGAYNAVMLALAPEIAEVAGYDRASIGGVGGIAGPYDFLPLRDDTMRAAFGAACDLAATQPINRTDPTAPPMILMTGTADTVVAPGNADRLAAELRAAGTRAEVVRYEGVGH